MLKTQPLNGRATDLKALNVIIRILTERWAVGASRTPHEGTRCILPERKSGIRHSKSVTVPKLHIITHTVV